MREILFFNSDIHIVGFGFDYSEIDLWWILNKRARMMLANNSAKQIKNKKIIRLSPPILPFIFLK